MDSGSSKGFDFASDDILCSYEDYANQQKSNGSAHSDSVIATDSSKEYNKSRMSRIFPTSSYSPPDDSANQDVVIAAVERSMKKHSDNLMRFLEGLSSRLSQLELYCYNVDKSIGEMRSDLTRDHGESDAKLKFLEKHLQEVHRSVQLIRDKQELADTQKELAKLQLAQKETSSGHESQKSEETSSTPSSDTKKNENAAEAHGQQLALALPHQVAPQPQMPPQPQTYYMSPSPLPNMPLPPGPTQLTQNHYQSDPHYQTPPPPRTQVSQPQPQIPQYQQQWPQPPVRPSSPQVFPQYIQSQQVNPSTPETLPNSMPYGYGGPGQTPQQPPQHLKPPYGNDGYVGAGGPGQTPQHLKPAYGGGQPSDGYVGAGGPQVNSYMMYENEPGRVPHPNHPTNFPPQSVYPPNQQQNSGGSNMMARPPPQFMRNNPYSELIDKLGSMGFRVEHVMSVIQRLEENGQTVDFNAVLDRLNVNPSGGTQRGWSG